MLRLLVIDDEPFIVDWIHELFSQCETLDLDIQKAYSAAEALEYLNRAKIDIVLTDIQMPDMDGIQLMKAIKASWPACRVIFLTAHDEFEYAHIASKDGVTYILKTESDEEIVNAVRKAAEEIEQSQWQQEVLETARRQMTLFRPMLQREFLSGVLKGSARDTASQEMLDSLEIPLRADQGVLMLIGRTLRGAANATLLDKAHEFAAMEAIVDGCLMVEVRRFHLRTDDEVGVWMLQPETDDWEKTLLAMRGSLESLQNKFGSSLHSSSVFISDHAPCRWEELPDRFSALLLLMNRSLLREGGMTVTRMLPPQEAQGVDQDDARQGRLVHQWLEQIQVLRTFLESGQRESFLALFSDLQQALLPVVAGNRALWRETAMALTLMFVSVLNRSGALSGRISERQDLMDVLRVDEHWRPEQAFIGYGRLAEMIFEGQSEERISTEERLIRDLHDYIQRHLDGDVSLVKLAEIAYLSPAYLSRLYKQTTGGNLSDYIQQQRMDKARQLLANSRDKIYEISAKVGFDSVNYFIRTFKKQNGMTPQDFRNASGLEDLDNKRQQR